MTPQTVSCQARVTPLYKFVTLCVILERTYCTYHFIQIDCYKSDGRNTEKAIKQHLKFTKLHLIHMATYRKRHV